MLRCYSNVYTCNANTLCICIGVTSSPYPPLLMHSLYNYYILILVSSVYMCRYLHGLPMPEGATRSEKCTTVACPVMKGRCDLPILSTYACTVMLSQYIITFIVFVIHASVYTYTGMCGHEMPLKSKAHAAAFYTFHLLFYLPSRSLFAINM